MLLLQVLLSTAALLLIVAGVTKLRSPIPAVRAARAMRLPATTAGIRTLAMAEVAIGGAAILTDATVVRLAMGALYVAFLGFVLVAMWRRLPISSCGCFGADDAPPSLVHVAIDAAAAAVAFVAVGDTVEAPLDVVSGSSSDAVALVVGAALLTGASALALAGRVPRRSGRSGERIPPSGV